METTVGLTLLNLISVLIAEFHHLGLESRWTFAGVVEIYHVKGWAESQN